MTRRRAIVMGTVVTGVVALGLVGACARVGSRVEPMTAENGAERQARAIEVTATALLDAPRAVDRIEIRQVLALVSSDPAFGGYSGLVTVDDGAMFLATSDRGTWLHLVLADDATGRIERALSARVAPILDPNGHAVEGRMANDAESLIAIDEGFVVGFEGAHRLWRYACSAEALLECTPTKLRSPRAIRLAEENSGFEAVARLADGRLLAIAEELFDRRGHLRGWVASRPGARWRDVTLPAEGAFRPTSLVGLENGDAVLVERSYSRAEGVRVRISRLIGEDIRPGRALERDVLAHLDESLPIDNLEAAHAVADPEGGTTLYVISDDNFSARQRTLLLEIRLPPLE